MPSNGSPPAHDMRLEQKRKEMELADLTLVASRYVEATVLEFYPHKDIARTPYGVDVEFWSPGPTGKPSGPLRFIYAGNVSVRKGMPLLIEAWSKAALRDAELNACRFLGTFRGQKAILASRHQMVSSPLFAGAARSVSRVSTCLCSHRILTALDWLCSKLWHVVCLRSLPKQALVPKS